MTQEKNNNFKQWIAPLIAFVLVVGGWSFYQTLHESKESKGRDALYLARKSLQEEVKNSQISLKTLGLDLESKIPNALKKLQDVAETHASTRAGFEAQFDLGNLYSDVGDYKKAEKWYRLAAKNSPNRMSELLSLSASAYNYVSEGNFKDAIADFQKAIQLKEGMVGELKLGLARAQIGAKLPNEAIGTLESVKKEFPDSDLAREAQRLAQEAK